MVEAGEDLGFPLEPGEPIRIRGERLGQDPERHLPVELGIRWPDRPGPCPLADKGSHVVMGDAGADFESHRIDARSEPIIVLPAVGSTGAGASEIDSAFPRGRTNLRQIDTRLTQTPISGAFQSATFFGK